MAKKQPSKVIHHFPEGFIQVTEANRKFCLKTGKTMYVIKPTVKGYDNLGDYPLRPRLVEGWMTIDGKRVRISETEDRKEYIDTFNDVNNWWIEKGFLFVNPNKELIKYELP